MWKKINLQVFLKKHGVKSDLQGVKEKKELEGNNHLINQNKILPSKLNEKTAKEDKKAIKNILLIYTPKYPNKVKKEKPHVVSVYPNKVKREKPHVVSKSVSEKSPSVS